MCWCYRTQPAMRSPIIIIQMQEIVVIYVFAKVGGIA